MNGNMGEPLFGLGQIVATPNALMHLGNAGETPNPYIARHMRGDWGDALPDEDKATNDAALKSGRDRLFSAYTIKSGEKMWIITEWDRSVTTVLMPEDY